MNLSAASLAHLSKRNRWVVVVEALAVAVVVKFSVHFAHHGLQDNRTQGVRRSLVTKILDNDAPPRKRIALIRPFSTQDGEKMLNSFASWDDLLPCTAIDEVYDVDLVLSYSRRLDDGDSQVATDVMRAIQDETMKAGEAGGAVGDLMHWSRCFSGHRIIETDIEPSKDKYENDHTGIPSSLDWVAGPNSQFRETLSQIMGYEYDLAMVMEADMQVRRTGWLSVLLNDIRSKSPFAILGSKFKGKAWDEFRDLMPQALLDHINGNAVYNLTSPLFQVLLHELNEEAGTEWDAVSYDYRMSQIVHEVQSGTPPIFPFPWMADPESLVRASKRNKYRVGLAILDTDTLWKELDTSLIKETNAIANFGKGNYLESHVDSDTALVHGPNKYEPWNPDKHVISLVVSAWNDSTGHSKLIQEFDTSHYHPFKEIIILEDSHTGTQNNMHKIPISDRVHVRERVSADVVDVCNAPVKTEWFFYTNAYHRVVSKVDLLFTQGVFSKPLIPYTPADSVHCNDYEACTETLRLAREIYPAMDKIILDMDIPYHTPSRDAFCEYWKANYGRNGEVLKKQGRRLTSAPLSPTATSFVAYLYKMGIAEKVYSFTNVLIHGSTPLFTRVGSDDAEIEDKSAQQKHVKSPKSSPRQTPGATSPRALQYGRRPTPPPTPSPSSSPSEAPSTCELSCETDNDCPRICHKRNFYDPVGECVVTPPPTSPNTPPAPVPTSAPVGSPTTSAPTQCICTDPSPIPDKCEVAILIDIMEAFVTPGNFNLIAQWTRAAFHDAGTFDKNVPEGGANGCLLTDNGIPPGGRRMRDMDENRHLDQPLIALQTIFDEWHAHPLTCIDVSHADIIQFAIFFATIRQHNTPENLHSVGPGGGDVPAKRAILIETSEWGRPDEQQCDTAWTDNLPGFSLPTSGTLTVTRCVGAAGEIEDKMMDRNGFTKEEANALIGAHTIGLVRNTFGISLSGPWAHNGRDDATPQGPVFDNGFHRFLMEDIQADTMTEFIRNPLPSIRPFNMLFPDWFRDNDLRMNHLDTDVILKFPTHPAGAYPDFHSDTERFANDNVHFLDVWGAALSKMGKLGVNVTLFTPTECESPCNGSDGKPTLEGVFKILMEVGNSTATANMLAIRQLSERREEIRNLTEPDPDVVPPLCECPSCCDGHVCENLFGYHPQCVPSRRQLESSHELSIEPPGILVEGGRA